MTDAYSLLLRLLKLELLRLSLRANCDDEEFVDIAEKVLDIY
jgi:hypothetical protein